MMTLSTSTGLASHLPDGSFYSIEAAMNELYAAGFRYLDANLWGLGLRGKPLSEPSWRDWAYRTREYADRLGIRFRQTHGQTLSGGQWDDPGYAAEAERIWEINYRAIETTRILGADWMVMHPFNLPHDPIYNRAKAREANLAYLAPFLDAAKREGIGIAVENMVDFGGRRRRYCGGDPEELIELVDTIGDPSLGICIDMGHAHVSGIDAGAFIRMAGNRLKCTHIDDNNRDGDAHLPPYFGSVNWQDVMAALRAIGYEGDFSFEVGSYRIPHEGRADWYRYLHQLGESLLQM